MSEKKITVTRVIDAPASEIFQVLSNPERHSEFDGSGTVRSDEKSNRIQSTGDVFVMNMFNEEMGGDYKMHNHVTGFDQNRLISWQPAEEERKDSPAGWEWTYRLESQGSDSTEVSLTYSWENLTDSSIEHIFPAISEKELEESLNQLASVVSG
ncbi:MAG: SRPBCC family protein [bacterium]|nr:SRPBCC family protein [bacterium]